jgi:uncharacterized protein involved in exopolysaccharide biosynthesis
VGASTKQNLESARLMLTALQLRLKPEHPDVLRLKSTIATLEAKLQEEEKAEAAVAAALGTAAPPVALTQPEMARRERLQTIRAQIESLERQIAFKEAEEQRVRNAMDALQSRIEQIPGVESEWVALTRDYATQQQAYQQLLSKSQDAKLAANLEQRQIGEQFRILDPARTPVRPTGVNRLEINGIGAAIGLGLGLAIAALLEFRDQTFRQSVDIREVLRLPVVALVPRVISPEDQRRMKLRSLLISATAAVVVLASAYGFWAMQLWKFVV